jgi:hypothetical protein
MHRTIQQFLLGMTLAASTQAAVVDHFDHGAGEWRTYDFNGLPFGDEGGNGGIYHYVTWEARGGVGDSGYVWTDQSRWRIDTPETPDSILAFITYRDWIGAGTLDLRGAKLSVNLRGDELDAKGATLHFWVLNNALGVRYHYTGQALSFADGTWADRQSLVLVPDASRWTMSWQRYADESPSGLDAVLGAVDSYGFSFLGFPHGEEVTGRLAMDELVLSVPEPGTGALLAAGAAALAGWRRRVERRRRSAHHGLEPGARLRIAGHGQADVERG